MVRVHAVAAEHRKSLEAEERRGEAENISLERRIHYKCTETSTIEDSMV